MNKTLHLLVICFLTLQFAAAQTPLQHAIAGKWTRTLVTTDEQSGTNETQRSVRKFVPDGTLAETVVYEEEVRDNNDEIVVFSFLSSIEGKWAINGNDILIVYNCKTLKVEHLGTSFPEHDDAVQGSLRRAFEKRNKVQIKNYLSTIRNVLKGYYKHNSGSALRDVEIHGNTMTATMGKEIVAFSRELQ